MKELFGLSIDTIMVVLLLLLGAALATTAAVAIGNRTMFRMGVRNLPRRGTQTILVVVGLTLSTLIVTAAFATGDTIDYSLTKGGYDLFQRSDLDVSWNGERHFGRDAGAANSGAIAAINQSVVSSLDQQFAGDPDIAGFLPAFYQQVAASDQRSGVSAPAVQLAGFDPARLSQLGGLHLVDGGQPDLAALGANDLLLSERAAKDLKAKTGDTVTLFAPAGPHDFHVAGVVQDEIASGVLGLSYSNVPGGVAMPLASLQTLLGQTTPQINALTVALKGDVRSTVSPLASAAQGRVKSFIASPRGEELFSPSSGLESGRQVEVFAAKKDTIENGQETGNVFTTLFLVLGLFSMASGIMLIFMIFVMLAAERKAEMGMARAVGAQRSHLLQSFVAEGMAYSLLAGIVGVVLGVGASVGLTNWLLPFFGGDYFSIVVAHVTWKSVVIGYSLGVVITFLTVVIAAAKVSRINIVSAIRSLPEETRRAKRHVRWGWVIAGVATLPIVPIGVWFLFRKGLGFPWAWILGPLGVIAGALLMLLGKSSGILAPFAIGISIIPLSVAGFVRSFGAPNRLTWSTVGALLLAYWLLPSEPSEAIFGKFSSNIEMFLISGIMIVVASTLVIVFNARILTSLFGRSAGTGNGAGAYLPTLSLAGLAIAAAAAGFALGDRGDQMGQLLYLASALIVPAALLAWASVVFPQLGPALKMAIAYPLSNRFRTGMTIAMFALIIFSLTVFSILLANFGVLDGGNDARGNIDIVAIASQGSTVSDIPSALRELGAPEANKIAASGRVSLDPGAQEVRQTGIGTEWQRYPVLAADDGFLGGVNPALEAYARGYTSNADVLAAVRTQPNLALIDLAAFGQGFNDSYEWTATVTAKDHLFDPFQVELHNPVTNATTTVTVVGVLKTRLPSDTKAGIYVADPTYRSVYGTPSYQRTYLRLSAGTDAKVTAAGIESALATRGVSADSVQKILDDLQRQDVAFNRMFQAFMALGLVVGIAGLGVIAFRSVVERRQQIGMLRAIGFQRETVTLAFLLESSFVAVMGILSGVVGGAILAHNLMTSEGFTQGASVQFAIPWAEVALIVGAAFIFALMMTWWPSRGAAKVPVAEALRYE